MANTDATTPRIERIRAARKKLQARIAAKHPNSKDYIARIAEYDASEARLMEAAVKTKKV